MNAGRLAGSSLQAFRRYLILKEKSTAAVEKYLRDARAFLAFADCRMIKKELTVAYKNVCKGLRPLARSIKQFSRTS